MDINYYFLVNTPIDKIREFLSDLRNQSINIPDSYIIGIMRDSKDKNKFIVVFKAPLIGAKKVHFHQIVNGNVITYKTFISSLVLRYVLHRYDEDATLVHFYAKKGITIPPYVNRELYLAKIRFIEALKKWDPKTEIIDLSEDEFKELLRRAKERSEVKVEEEVLVEEKEIVGAEEVEKAPKIPATLPISGASTEARIIVKKEASTETISKTCSACLLFDEGLRYCTLLMKRVEEPSKPLCGGESFIPK